MVSLVFGLLFVGVAVWWMVGGPGDVGAVAGWLAVGILGLVGLIGLVTAASRRRTAAEPHPDDATDPGIPTVPDPLAETDEAPASEAITQPDAVTRPDAMTEAEPGSRP
jgi:hypothetical protein